MTLKKEIEEVMTPLKEFARGGNNELGAYLPDPEAELCEESERIQAHNKREADKKCEKIAEEYNGTNPRVKPVGENYFDCIFGVWRES